MATYLKTFMENDLKFGYFPFHKCFDNSTFTAKSVLGENFHIHAVSSSDKSEEFISMV